MPENISLENYPNAVKAYEQKHGKGAAPKTKWAGNTETDQCQ